MTENVPAEADPVENYNPIFEKLVARKDSEPESLPGMVAYSLYKIAKREWTTAHINRTGGKPTEQELDAYIATWTPSRLDGLQQQGNGVLASFAQEVIDENQAAIREDALKGTFGRSIRHGVAAAATYTAILLILALGLRVLGIDLLGALQSIGPSNVISEAKEPT